MDILDCKFYHERILAMNCERIAKYHRRKLTSQIIGLTLFTLAILSLFTVRFGLDIDKLYKLSAIAGGLFFFSKDLISKPDIDGMKRDNLTREIVLKGFAVFDSLDEEEKERMRINCTTLIDKFSTQ